MFPLMLFGQSTGSFWKVETLITPIGKSMPSNTLIWCPGNLAWYKSIDSLSKTITISQALTAGKVVMLGTTGGSGSVVGVTAIAPLSVINPTTTPVFSIYQSGTSASGYLSSTDWNTFNGKEPALGNPAVNGYVLTSTTSGVRSWKIMTSGGGGGESLWEDAGGILRPIDTTYRVVTKNGTFIYPGDGDLNNSGTLTNTDYTYLRRYLVGLQKLTDLQKARADLDGDGRITMGDVKIMQIRMAELAIGTPDTLRYFNGVTLYPHYPGKVTLSSTTPTKTTAVDNFDVETGGSVRIPKNNPLYFGASTYSTNTDSVVKIYKSANGILSIDGKINPTLLKVGNFDVTVTAPCSIPQSGSMVYPGAGIALSTSTAWGTSIQNNSGAWNTAYGWGNHAIAGYMVNPMYEQGQMIFNDKDKNPTALNKGEKGDLLMQWEDDDGNPVPAWKSVSIPAAQIQSDWNQTNNTLLDYIKNKPTGLWGSNGSKIYYTAGEVGIGNSNPLYPLHVVGTADKAGYFQSTHTSGTGIYGTGTINGVQGVSTDGYGGYFTSTAGAGVRGTSTDWYGGYFSSTNATGLYASSVFVNGLLTTSSLKVGPYNVSVTGNVSIPQSISSIPNLQDSLNDRYRRKDTLGVLLSQLRAGHMYEPKFSNGTTDQYLNGLKQWVNMPTGKPVTSVTGTAPIVSSGGTTPAISIPEATISTDGYLSAAKFTVFNAKQSFPGFGTNHYTAAFGDHGHSGVYEPVIPTGASYQYIRGDKTLATFPQIPAGQIQSNWLQPDNGALDYIKNKPAPRITSPANGLSVAVTSESGNLYYEYSLALASTSTTGALSSTNWNTFNSKEPSLGNPTVTGYVLSSNTAGERSWIAPTGGSQWTTNGTSIYYNTGKVGVGITAPTGWIHSISTGSDPGILGDNSSYGSGTRGMAISGNGIEGFSSTGNAVYGRSLNGKQFYFGNDRTSPYDSIMVMNSQGYVGIGTINPTYPLYVIGTENKAIYAQSNSAVGIGVYGTGNSTGVSGVGGNYGIQGTGTTAGVGGQSVDGYGGHFTSTNGIGLYATSAYIKGTTEYNKETGVDHTASGEVIQLDANAATTIGDVVFINNIGEAQLCKADAITNCRYAFAVCASPSIGAHAAGKWLTKGSIRDDTWNWTVGGLIYVSTIGTTGNTLTQSAPSGSGNVIMPVGVALSADIMYFFGNVNSVEHQ